MNQSLKALYRFGPIRTFEKLAEVLGISVQELYRLRRRADNSYKLVGVRKKDGGIRITWNPARHLKSLQGRINSRLLHSVSYPPYLQGGIRDVHCPRDYSRNASMHVGQACIINEDVARFFPSITSAQVFDVWHELFRFPDEVAAALTDLTTRQGFLPQGARTSSYLANLIFWRSEPEFVRYLSSKGLRYSRFVDDITVSSSVPLSSEQKSNVKSAIHSFMKRGGFTRNYRKQQIYGAGHRMVVNNLIVNKRAALSREKRAEIRDLVRQIVRQLATGQPELQQGSASARGKIALMTRFHRRDGERLQAMLDLHAPRS